LQWEKHADGKVSVTVGVINNVDGAGAEARIGLGDVFTQPGRRLAARRRRPAGAG
jgi:hypothetical protein